MMGCLGKGLDMAEQSQYSRPRPHPPDIPGMLLGFNGDLLNNLQSGSDLPLYQTFKIPYGRAGQLGLSFASNLGAGGHIQVQQVQTNDPEGPINHLSLFDRAEVYFNETQGFYQVFNGTPMNLDIYFLGSAEIPWSYAPTVNSPYFMLQDTNFLQSPLSLRGMKSSNTSSPYQELQYGNTPTVIPSSFNKGFYTHFINFGLMLGCVSTRTFSGYLNFLDLFLDDGYEETELYSGSSWTSGLGCSNVFTPTYGGRVTIGDMPAAYPGTKVTLLELFIFDHKLTISEDAQMRQYMSEKYHNVSNHN